MKPNLKQLTIILLLAFVGMVEVASAFYDPGLQRWINRDPMEEAYDNNLYRSVYNNPINYIDPDGFWGIGIGSYNFGWGSTPTIQIGDPGWMDKDGERHAGTPPSEQKKHDPDSNLAQRGVDLDIFGGELPGDFIANKGKKVCLDSANTLAAITPIGEAKSVLTVGAKELEALSKAKALKNCEQMAAQAARTLDDILQNDDLFKKWLKSSHDPNKPVSASDAKKIWDKLVQMGKNPRLDPPGVRAGTKWDVPHINVDSSHIPVPPGFTP